MKSPYTVALAVVAGFGLGALAMGGLHAQAKPPVYYVAEIDVTDLDGYMKEFSPMAQGLTKKYGGRLVAASTKVTRLEGEPPKRAAVVVWDSVEKLQAWRNSPEMKEARKVGDKYAKFRSFAVDGVPQR